MAIRKKINPTIEIPMTVDEINEYRAMLDKAEPKPIVAYTFTEGGTEYYKCPVCGGSVYKGHKFCSTCGQAIDTEVIAL